MTRRRPGTAPRPWPRTALAALVLMPVPIPVPISALILALLLAMAAGGGARAQDLRAPSPSQLRPGIGAEDPRRQVDRQALPWRALGRVQTETGNRCTGVLIGPRSLLTAAHCLLARNRPALVQPTSVHFLLGYHDGDWVAHARGVSFIVGIGFTPGIGAAGPAGADWALITLDRPIGTPDRRLPLLREPPPERSPLMLGGYQRDRPERLMADTGCRLLGRTRTQTGHVLLVHDCAGTSGVSGGPVLAPAGDGVWGVVAVAVAVAASDMALGYAVPLTEIDRLP